ETLTAFGAAGGADATPVLPGPGAAASGPAVGGAGGALAGAELLRLRQLLGPAPPSDDTEPTGAAPAPSHWPSVPGYEVLGELGRGGMGVVYKARQLRLNRLVALKVLRADAVVSLAQRPRFVVEGEALARLQHPNVVQIYDVG